MRGRQRPRDVAHHDGQCRLPVRATRSAGGPIAVAGGPAVHALPLLCAGRAAEFADCDDGWLACPAARRQRSHGICRTGEARAAAGRAAAGAHPSGREEEEAPAWRARGAPPVAAAAHA
eukprot:6848638-Prymnesium_polylepis.1